MSPQIIERVERTADLQRVAATLGLAFQDDPALSWVVPDPERRRRMLPRFFAVMAAQSLRHGEVLAAREGEAASLWYPPGEVRESLVAGLVDNIRLLGQFGTALPRGLKVAETMHAHHPDPQPYAYLRYVGVAPQAQGKGWGGAIIRAGIERAARTGQGVLLETAKEDNVAIYTRLGFETVSQWQVPGGGPQFWTMVRKAD